MAKQNSRRGTRAETRGSLSRTRILEAAVGIADRRGVGAVTMRAVAAKLGVQAMSLYNHVDNKDDILDGMVDVVVGEIAIPTGLDDWREAMRVRAVSAREVFGRHPWLPALLDSRTSSGEARLRYLDWVLGVLMRAGFTIERAAHAFSLLDSYIYGFGIEQVNFSIDSQIPAEERAALVAEHAPAEQYPYLNRMAMHAMQSSYDPDADFHFGLELILDGLERTLRDTHAEWLLG